jgi:hypothetical protein
MQRRQAFALSNQLRNGLWFFVWVPESTRVHSTLNSAVLFSRDVPETHTAYSEITSPDQCRGPEVGFLPIVATQFFQNLFCEQAL